METVVHGDVPRDAQCIACEYALYGNESGRCPECGREFNHADWTTYHSGTSKRAVRAVKRMLFCRMLMMITGCLVIACSAWGEAALGFLAATVVLALLTLCFQTMAVQLLLGHDEASKYFFAALFLAPLFLLGPILIPSLVAIELRKRVQV